MVCRSAASRWCERHPAVAVDELRCGGDQRVRLEHHAVRVDDVVALGGVGEHQLMAVLGGRRRRAGPSTLSVTSRTVDTTAYGSSSPVRSSGRASISIHFSA